MTRPGHPHGAINLSQGFPDFDGPELAREAAVAAIREGARPVRADDGDPELNRALSEKLRRDGGSSTPPTRRSP
jgi:aspartate/methionine/tyrosine aminotransferase